MAKQAGARSRAKVEASSTADAGRARLLWHQNTQMRTYVENGPRVIVEARGSTLRDNLGREYLDGLSTHNCCSLGHGRSEIVDAIASQLRRLDFSSLQMMSHEPALDLAGRLVSLAPGEPGAAYLVNSGSEAVETAFKLARQYFVISGQPRKLKIVSFRDSYHGNTLATTAAGGDTAYRLSVGPLPFGFVQIDPPEPNDDPQVAAQKFEEAILFEGPNTVAAFAFEPVAVHKGVRLFPTGYLNLVRDICNRHGILMIADEVICGFGRTGRLFGCHHWNVEPDIVTLGKALSGGHFPIGAVVAHRRIRDAFWESDFFPHFVTYSGHPGGCAAALAFLDILERDDVVAGAREVGRRLLDRLTEYRSLPVVGRVAGLGMLLSLELVADKSTRKPLPADLMKSVVPMAFDLGLFCGVRGGNWLFLAPPLTLTEEDANRLASKVGQLVQEIAKKAKGAAE